MAGHAAFLKGMNLGGRRITNEDLRGCVEALGLGTVETFRASGNVVFDGGRRSGATLQRTLERGLRRALGYDVPTFIRSAAEMREIAAVEPFPKSADGKLQVALLGKTPTAGARRTVLDLASAEDRLSFGERELFWLPANGVSGTALDWKAVERVLGATTVRTMGTMEQITTRWFAPAERT